MAIVAVEPQIIGIGDASAKKAAEELACLSAAYQMYEKGFVSAYFCSLTLPTYISVSFSKMSRSKSSSEMAPSLLTTTQEISWISTAAAIVSQIQTYCLSRLQAGGKLP